MADDIEAARASTPPPPQLNDSQTARTRPDLTLDGIYGVRSQAPVDTQHNTPQDVILPVDHQTVMPHDASLQRDEDASSLASEAKKKQSKFTLGILRDKQTDDVPGSVVLLSKTSKHNVPLGLNSMPRRNSASSLPSLRSISSPAMFRPAAEEKKKTANGKIILNPQPDDSLNDPLNWSTWRRDLALLSLGFYCMVGGGMTPVLAAGFNDVAATFDVSIPRVALTTGLYMMGLGVGSVIFSPTAIAWGKRPVYLGASILFLLSSVWCALSPNYASLVVARVVMGIAVSPVECLPSASIAEIYFLHERAYRLGIYTLLLLGGKNLVPLVSAVIINAKGWRWVFWVVAIVVGFCSFLLFFFVPETFWDRTPRPHRHHNGSVISHLRRMAGPFSPALHRTRTAHSAVIDSQEKEGTIGDAPAEGALTADIARRRLHKHAHFAAQESSSPGDIITEKDGDANLALEKVDTTDHADPNTAFHPITLPPTIHQQNSPPSSAAGLPQPQPTSASAPSTSPAYFDLHRHPSRSSSVHSPADMPPITSVLSPTLDTSAPSAPGLAYTRALQRAPPKSYLQTLRPFTGRLNHANWFRVALRPFVLFAYPAILWSSAVYACSVGWLIVLSEAVSTIYEKPPYKYQFTALQVGLVYISPFVGGVLGTAVAGKISDIIVRWMARRNDGVYEPEFRLVMAIPITLATTAGLMGYGWSAQAGDSWIVPTLFFGVVSFGCTLGSTTAITFAVDSYRQYAGEALVTLNWTKNIFHGLVFSLFFNDWLQADRSRTVFLALGGVQLAVMMGTVPLYIYGKRCRMYTVRKNWVEKL